jgi:hypothetical protein
MAALLFFIIGTPTGILRAWVVQHMWTWFVTPTFNVPTPKIAVIYGLWWFIGLLWPTPKPPTQDDDESATYNVVVTLVFSVFMSLMGLLIGSIAHGIAG